MQRPPALSAAPRTPATSGLALLALVVTLVSFADPARVNPLIVDGSAFAGEPWRLVTTTLVHADVVHLAFNLYWLWVFGTALERRFGSGRLLASILVCGAASTAAELALFGAGVGLSGVGYGLFGFCWMRATHVPAERELVDDQTVRLFLLWGVLCIVVTMLGFYPVANAAHGMGLLLGVCAGLATTRSRAWWIACLVLVGLSLVGASVGRRYVNLRRVTTANELAWTGWKKREAGDLRAAIRLLEDAVALDRTGVRLVQLADTLRLAKRYAEARAKFTEGCEKNEPAACGNLGLMLELGEGGAADPHAAHERYEQGCKLGSEASCQNARR